MKVLVNDPIDKEAVENLKGKHDVDVKELGRDELLEAIGEYEALIVRSRTKVPKEVIDRGAKLKVVAMAGIGVDHIDVAHATTKNIAVVNAPAGSTYSVAELAIGLIIALSRLVSKADSSMKAGLWEKKKLKGAELHGKTLGLIGIGRIGREVAERAKCFGMKLLAYDPYVPSDQMTEIGVQPAELEELLANSDYVSVHAAFTPETKGLVNLERMKKMKSAAYIVNTARGGIIDEKDLYDALKENVIAGAALDVFAEEPLKDSPLARLDNIILTPHIGANTREAQKKAGVTVAEDVLRVLAGEKPEFVVNEELYSGR
jgi:D-3-phosphoglycerate dehydrogenase